jgi:hypothetical protein
MAEGRDLVKEAIQDAKSLKEAAVESAKKELVEALAPAVKELLDKSIRGALKESSPAGHVGGVRKINGKVRSGEQRAQNADPAHPNDVDENATPGLALEDALQEFFPAIAEGEAPNLGEETQMDVNEKKSSKKSSKKFGKSSKTMKESKKSSAVSEEIEISEAELRKVYQAALQTEVQVKKGFSDIVGGGELDQASKETGILDKKGGEKMFNDEEPPHKKDWIPEMKQMVARGLQENKALRENLRKAVAMIETLGKKLHEVNLFNAKVLHVNKILNSGAKLTREQKTFVMESIDKARSISEVKMVFETLQGSIKTTQAALTESRQVRPPKANAQRPRTTGTPDQKVLSESVDRGGNQFSRMQELAGLLK